MRLIDADALKELALWETYDNSDWDYQYVTTDQIDNSPTIETEPNSCEYWDSESRFCALRRRQAEPQRAYEQGVKDALDKYDETFRIASNIRTMFGINTAKECWELVRNGEIQKVKHGRWVIKYGDGHEEPAITGGECSICGYVHTVTNYCPNCGARMDEVTE